MFLEVENLQAGYGTEEVLHGVSLRVDEGEIVSILGANGAGKTTTLLTISGLVRASGGAVRFQGEDLHTLPSHEVVRRGLTQSPEGRRVFGVLSVLENLRLGAFTVGDKEKAEQTLDWIFDSVPPSARAQGSACRDAFRRRTADAGHRACAHGPAQAAVAG